MLYLNIIFPTVVGIEHNFLSESENNYIADKCYSLGNKISLQHDRWGSGEKSPLNSFDSYVLHKDNEFNLLFDKMNELVNIYAKANEDYEQYICSSSWFNIYNNESYQEPHYHRMCTYSVVYFSKVPKNSGEIVFINPVHSEAVEGSSSLAATDFWKYAPQENTAIIFRSSISHFVLHGKNNEDRISIAANYSLSPSSYEKAIQFNV